MPARVCLVFAFVASVLAALPAAAQDGTPVEVTPYVGIGPAGSLPVGVVVTFPVTQTLSFETDVARQRNGGPNATLSSSYSLLYSLPHVGQSTPYLAGGVGVTQYTVPAFFSGRGVPVGTQQRLAFTVNAGGGLKMPVNDTLGWRTDARWFHTAGRGSDQFRVTQGISFAAAKR
jgi:hypothetical protein